MTGALLDIAYRPGQTLAAYLAEMFGTPAQQAADWSF